MSKPLSEMIAVMQAAESGVPIQFRSLGWEDDQPWIDCKKSPVWDWKSNDYRAKIFPEVLYVNKTQDGRRYFHPSKEDACTAAANNQDSSAEKYQYIAKKFVEEEA